MPMTIRIEAANDTLVDHTRACRRLSWSQGRNRLPLYRYLQPGRAEIYLPDSIAAPAQGRRVEIDIQGRPLMRGWVMATRRELAQGLLVVEAGDGMAYYGQQRVTGLFDLGDHQFQDIPFRLAAQKLLAKVGYPGADTLAAPAALFDEGALHSEGNPVEYVDAVYQIPAALRYDGRTETTLTAYDDWLGDLVLEPVRRSPTDATTRPYAVLTDFHLNAGLQREARLNGMLMVYHRGNGELRLIGSSRMLAAYSAGGVYTEEVSKPRQSFLWRRQSYGITPERYYQGRVTVANPRVGRVLPAADAIDWPASVTLGLPILVEVDRPDTVRDVTVTTQSWLVQSEIAVNAVNAKGWLTPAFENLVGAGGFDVEIGYRLGDKVTLWSGGAHGDYMTLRGYEDTPSLDGYRLFPPHFSEGQPQYPDLTPIEVRGHAGGIALTIRVGYEDDRVPGATARAHHLAGLEVDFAAHRWLSSSEAGPYESYHRGDYDGISEVYQSELGGYRESWWQVGERLLAVVGVPREEYRLTYVIEDIAEGLGVGAAAQLEPGSIIDTAGIAGIGDGGMVCEGLQIDLASGRPGRFQGRVQVFGRERV